MTERTGLRTERVCCCSVAALDEEVDNCLWRRVVDSVGMEELDRVRVDTAVPGRLICFFSGRGGGGVESAAGATARRMLGGAILAEAGSTAWNRTTLKVGVRCFGSRAERSFGLEETRRIGSRCGKLSQVGAASKKDRLEVRSRFSRRSRPGRLELCRNAGTTKELAMNMGRRQSTESTSVRKVLGKAEGSE